MNIPIIPNKKKLITHPFFQKKTIIDDDIDEYEKWGKEKNKIFYNDDLYANDYDYVD